MDYPKHEPAELVKILNACGGKGHDFSGCHCKECPLQVENVPCFYAWAQAAELIEQQAAEIERLSTPPATVEPVKTCSNCRYGTYHPKMHPCAECLRRAAIDNIRNSCWEPEGSADDAEGKV